jgi:hypothetical protein
MSPKAKSEPGPRWAVINENFPLTEVENQIINRHDAVWKEHCDGGKLTDSNSINQEFRSFEMDAECGDLKALENLNRFGTPEGLMRFRRAEQTGRRARFDRENCGLFVETHAIAKRLREIFEKLLREYRLGGEDERKLLGLPAVINDDCTALLERQITALFAAESHTPGTFETLGNHINLVEIEEDAE